MTTDAPIPAAQPPKAQPSRAQPEPGVVRRALWIAVAWSYVAALGAILVVGITALVALIVMLVLYLLDFSTRQLDLAAAWSLAIAVGWVAGPVAIAISIWVAAYGSTQRNSVRSGTLAVGAASVGALVLWVTGSLGIVTVALAAGWAFAIPTEHAGRWIARVLLAIGLLPVYPIWDGVGVEVIVFAAITGPIVAGISVLVGDLLWILMLRLRARGQTETMRSPTSLDV